MTITKEQLDYMLAVINNNSRNKYDLDFAYGKCRLVRKCEQGGVVGMTVYGSKRETYLAMNAIYAWMVEERV